MNSNQNLEPYAACVGFDWGDRQHAIAWRASDSQTVQTLSLDHSPEKLHQWIHDLQEEFGGRSIALAIEGTPGAVLPCLLEYPWLQIYSIHPATSCRYRAAFTPSNAKDDVPDAKVLLELVEDHRDKLSPLSLDDAPTRRLDALCKARRDLVDRRKQTINQLTSLLKTYYPQALELCGEDLATAMAIDFLERWPDLLALKKARAQTIRQFYYGHNVRSQTLIDQRLERIDQARCLSSDQTLVEVATMQLASLLEEMEVRNKHIQAYDRKISQAMKEHSEAALFNNLPGAGPVLAPRLLVAFGTDRSRYPDASSMQKYVGVAPVREKSGSSQWIHWRWNAPTFLRQTFVEWAGQTVRYCDWAGDYYRMKKAQGKGHSSILRSLAFKWIRILWKCWQTRTPYDNARYTEQLRKRNSPLVKMLSAET